MRIKYKAGYKYQLSRTYVQDINIPGNMACDYIKLQGGTLTIKKGYAWDGPSGPTIDTKTFMRGSLVHDALYQFMRQNKLAAKYRKRADQLLRSICLEDGMNRFRAWGIYRGVRRGAERASKAGHGRKVRVAP